MLLGIQEAACEHIEFVNNLTVDALEQIGTDVCFPGHTWCKSTIGVYTINRLDLHRPSMVWFTFLRAQKRKEGTTEGSATTDAAQPSASQASSAILELQSAIASVAAKQKVFPTQVFNDLNQPAMSTEEDSAANTEEEDTKTDEDDDYKDVKAEKDEEEEDIDDDDDEKDDKVTYSEASTEPLAVDSEDVNILKDDEEQTSHQEKEKSLELDKNLEKQADRHLLDLNDDQAADGAAATEELNLDSDQITSNIVVETMKTGATSPPKSSVAKKIDSAKGRIEEPISQTPIPALKVKNIAATSTTPVPDVAVVKVTSTSTTQKRKSSIKARVNAKHVRPSLIGSCKSPWKPN
ncbi:eisosome protein SEG2-like [Hibiscus syriacus]|uniref:eisosome protein SEG2-like n=1 Tax=Hibiscus syriacus TaxID=106335 RepID=UPI001924901F|nr:eisosome protein SEG2-like [Hibiscus syriacus]